MNVLLRHRAMALTQQIESSKQQLDCKLKFYRLRVNMHNSLYQTNGLVIRILLLNIRTGYPLSVATIDEDWYL